MNSEYVWIIVIVAVVVILFFKSSNVKPMVENPTDSDVAEALKQGNKIKAIKYYREVHKVGLKAAKEAVEAMGNS